MCATKTKENSRCCDSEYTLFMFWLHNLYASFPSYYVCLVVSLLKNLKGVIYLVWRLQNGENPARIFGSHQRSKPGEFVSASEFDSI